MTLWERLKKSYMAVLVLLAIVIVGSFFISRKEGYHMDEMLTFELANAEFTPWIVTTQPQGRLEKYVVNELRGESPGDTLDNIVSTLKDVMANRGNSKLLTYEADVYDEPVWITNREFRDYITVGSEDAFNYLSVYFNVKDDNHPPLHFMLVHTISSVFRGQVTPWMGCIINLLLILGIGLLLMDISRRMTGDAFDGIAASLLYALSIAGLQTLLLIRMYALLTFFCVLVFDLHLKKFSEEKPFRRHNAGLIAAIVGGFVTQYFFLFYMIFLGLGTVVYLWKKDSAKAAFRYIRTMLIAAIWGLLLYPFAVDDVLHSGRGVEAVQNLGSGFSDLAERFAAFAKVWWKELLGGLPGVICLVCLIALGILFCLIRKGKHTTKSVFHVSYLWLLLIPVAADFILTMKAAPYYEDRYMMPLFPFASLLLIYALHAIGVRIGAGRFLPMAGALALVVSGIVTVSPSYLYTGYAEQIAVSEAYADCECLCVYDGYGYYQNLVEFTNYASTLMVTEQELTERSKDATLVSADRLVVLLKNGIDESAVQEVLSSYGLQESAVLLKDGVHGDTLYLYE